MTITFKLKEEEIKKAIIDYVECTMDINMSDFTIKEVYPCTGQIELSNILELEGDNNEEH